MDVPTDNLVYFSSAPWKGISPPPPEPSDTISKATEPLVESSPEETVNHPSSGSSARKIQWKRPAKRSTTHTTTNRDIYAENGLHVYLTGTSVLSAPSIAASSPENSTEPNKRKSQPPSTQKIPELVSSKHPQKQVTKTSHILNSDDYDANDPYSLPISPISSRRTHKDGTPKRRLQMTSELVKENTTNLPSAGLAAKPTPAGKRPAQKRVAKRSFLDPESPQVEKRVVRPKPAPKPTTKSVAKLPAKKIARTSGYGNFFKAERPSPVSERRTLRPRRERVPIEISSDSESSFDGDDCHVEENHSDFYMLDSPQNEAPEIQKKTAHDETQDEVDDCKAEDKIATTKQPKSQKRTYDSVSGRAALKLGVEDIDAQQIGQKRHLSPDITARNTQAEKRPKWETAQEAGLMDNGCRSSQPRESKTRTLEPASDPFSDDPASTSAPTEFTVRLLNSTTEPKHSGPVGHQRRPQPAEETVQLTMAEQNEQVQTTSAGIVQQMMQALADSGNKKRGLRGQAPCDPSEGTWTDEMDPYRETGQIMSYVCKTILRCLKSKEAAIDDVASEYQQRGNAVIGHVQDLHRNERRAVAERFEDCRQQSIRILEAAHADAHALAAKFGHVNLAPAVNDVLADETVFRLRALQGESGN